MKSPHSLRKKGNIRCFLLSLISFGPTYALVAATQLNAASFDCSKANTAVEHMICGQEELSKLDGELGEAYVMAIKKAPDSQLLKEQQSEWLKTRERCDDPACVQQLYVKRIGVLERIISLVPVEKGEETYFFETEAGKLKVIQDAVRQQRVLYSHPIASEPNYCNEFMSNLVADTIIEAIEPAFATEHASDPRLDKLNTCRNYPFEEGLAPESFEGVSLLGNPPYRYYELDLDGKQENGKEIIYYHEQGALGSTGYTWVDPNVCEVIGGATIQSILTNDGAPRALYRLNTLVRFRGDILALSLLPISWEPKPSRYGVFLTRVSQGERRFCAWRPGN